MNVLLVESNYKNKYPPIGLMKISTYHKNKGDNVLFFKGKLDSDTFMKLKIERVYITTLFTFHYSITLDTINYYQTIIDSNRIYIGGILATLMYERLHKDLKKKCIIIKKQLTNSNMIGFEDNINIDCLPLDYSILDDVEYKYPSGDNYFAYISRGCCNKCEFCAVPTLEPKLMLTNNIIEQIHAIENAYGKKQNLLLMDNNILSFNIKQLSEIVEDIYSLGFDKETKFISELPFDTYMRKLKNLSKGSTTFNLVLKDCIAYLNEKLNTRKSKIYNDKYIELLELINQGNDKFSIIYKYEPIIREILAAYYKPKGRKRSVDFNQGMDARILSKNEEKMKILSKIPISPFRLAFDKLEYKKDYETALRLAHKYGVTEFSNYLLYNFDEKPEELWERLKININLAKELKVKIFSFPMKYAPVNEIDRSYVGGHWNKQFLSNIHAILNVTKGIVAGGQDFFYRAYGRDIKEYFKILSMPREFVTYRNYFESIGLTEQWEVEFNQLTNIEKSELIHVLSTNKPSENKKIIKILKFYCIKYKSNIIRNEEKGGL